MQSTDFLATICQIFGNLSNLAIHGQSKQGLAVSIAKIKKNKTIRVVTINQIKKRWQKEIIMKYWVCQKQRTIR